MKRILLEEAEHLYEENFYCRLVRNLTLQLAKQGVIDSATIQEEEEEEPLL